MIHFPYDPVCHYSGKAATAAVVAPDDDAAVVSCSLAAGWCCGCGSLLRPVVCRTTRQTGTVDPSGQWPVRLWAHQDTGQQDCESFTC